MMKLAVVAAAALAVTGAFADKVMLKSGSFLTGTVSGVSGDTVTFNSDDLGEVKIKVANIVKLEDAGEHVVRYNDNTRQTKRLAVDNGVYVVNTKPLDMSNVKDIDPVEETWHGSVHFAYNSARGNTREDSATILGNINRRWEYDRFNGNFGYYYSKTGTSTEEAQTTKDKWEAELQHDHFWLPKTYTYENLKWERDQIQDLNARYRLGLGLGYQWLDNTDVLGTGPWSFNQELGANWIKEEYAGRNDDVSKDGFGALRYAHHLEWSPIWVKGVNVFHNAEILPQADDWEKFLAKCDLGLTTKIVYDWDLLAKIEWEYNSKPVDDRKYEDVRYILGLGYKW
jgi:putative salt-induced outer membrane protein YdiY